MSKDTTGLFVDKFGKTVLGELSLKTYSVNYKIILEVNYYSSFSI